MTHILLVWELIPETLILYSIVTNSTCLVSALQIAHGHFLGIENDDNVDVAITEVMKYIETSEPLYANGDTKPIGICQFDMIVVSGQLL